MRVRTFLSSLAIVAGAVIAVAASAQPAGRGVTRPPTRVEEPVVVELFTAQGCAGCLDANAVLEGLADRPGVIALTYGVDYWDYLGWTDTVARPEFARRQRAYQAAMGMRGVYTPQVILDGHRQLSGAQARAVRSAVEEEAAGRAFPPQIEFRETRDRVGVGSGRPPAGGAEVWAAIYAPGPRTTVVSGGDNRGRLVRQSNVVRALVRLGDWSGRPSLYDLPSGLADGEAVAVMLQAKRGRRIVAAAVMTPDGR